MYNYNYYNDEWIRNFNTNSNPFMNNLDLRNNLNSINTQKALFNPTEAYNYGNLFADLYSQYKNYKPIILTARNEREQLLLELSRLAFAAHELNLYLDLNPNDEAMLKLFNDYRRSASALTEQYEAKYGPLNIQSNSLENSPFVWEKAPWPWEGRYNV